jgi:hypothetical protein
MQAKHIRPIDSHQIAGPASIAALLLAAVAVIMLAVSAVTMLDSPPTSHSSAVERATHAVVLPRPADRPLRQGETVDAGEALRVQTDVASDRADRIAQLRRQVAAMRESQPRLPDAMIETSDSQRYA